MCDLILEMDRILFELAPKLRLLKAVRPQNEAEARARFLGGKEPELVYPEPIRIKVARLHELSLPQDEPLAKLLEGQRQQLLAAASALAQEKSVADVSRSIYGCPSSELEQAARRLLRELPVEKPRCCESLPKVRRELREALARCQMSGWKVGVSPGDWTAAWPLERKILVTRVGPVPAGTAARLAVHEVGVHALRAHNGFQQRMKLFGYGLPGYESTEEGLAVYAELLTGTADARILRRYAARVVAVSALDRGLTFRQSYEELLELGLSELQGWATVLRARRGGGLFKDHIYLEGLFKVMSYLRRGGSLELLYVGKVGLEHLELVREGLAQGWLSPPAKLPWFLEQEPDQTGAWRLIEDLAA